MRDLKPEERAREWIDRKLSEAGWKVVNREEFAPGMTAVAVREAAMKGGLRPTICSFSTGRLRAYSKPSAPRLRSITRT